LTDEHELIAGLARGDRAAFRELVETHKKKVYFLALDMVGNPVDAEDVSQEVFLKVFRSFDTFRQGAKLGSWLYRITYNACIDHLRKRVSTPEPMEDEVLEAGFRSHPQVSGPREATDPAIAVEHAQLRERIERALETFSPQEKAVFLLRHHEDLALGDIAEAMGLSVGSVKSYLFRAVRKLRKELLPVGMEVSHE
jgi:RNA polymerase sigma-70 factor (ECF subfamily)